MILKVIGGGLAGSEAAWQAAERGIDVELYEMRPDQKTGAHRTGNLAELVCSNSLGSNLPDRASGLLKAELRLLNSMLISCADASSLPAGGALAVDRELFSQHVEQRIASHPRITVIRQEIVTIPESPAIFATGPLTSPSLSEQLKAFTGEDHLFFYDAISPVVDSDSVNMAIAFRANRYGPDNVETGDYLNCPFEKDAYIDFRNALVGAERIPLRTFESEIDSGVVAGTDKYFQGCQPIEVIASRGEKALAFGPMRPVGLIDPRTGRRPYAVVQLRQDNLAGDLYNLVGFQTNLTFSEQARVFKMIPGLENATFQRFGQMHRNAFLAAPILLDENLAFHQQPGLFVAGQLAGIEGYAGNIATGLVAGINAAHYVKGIPKIQLPQTTMIGALVYYITHANLKDFQPMKAMFGLLPKPEGEQRRSKKERYQFYAERALAHLRDYKRSFMMD
jgi:methylenetetrahydrofolate--tRNA-(uracil-5-)-methyltransferase